MLTADEIERVVAACAGRPDAAHASPWSARSGSTPADPLDAAVAAAFNAHQRRTVGGRTLLGPDAADAAVDCVRPARHRRGGPAEPVAAGPGAGRRWPPVVRRLARRGLEQRPDLAGRAAATPAAGWREAARRPARRCSSGTLTCSPGRLNRRPARARASARRRPRGDRDSAPVLPLRHRRRAADRSHGARAVWAWVRPLGGVAILAVLLWRVGTGPFLDGVRLIDAPALGSRRSSSAC